MLLLEDCSFTGEEKAHQITCLHEMEGVTMYSEARSGHGELGLAGQVENPPEEEGGGWILPMWGEGLPSAPSPAAQAAC